MAARRAVVSRLIKQERQDSRSALQSLLEAQGPGAAQSSPSGGKKLGQSFAKVTHDYTAANGDEVNLRKGDIVIILEQNDDGWWKGQVGHEEGWLPSTYVELISEQEVQKFIASQQQGARKGKTKEELQKEMKELKDELVEEQVKSQSLRSDIDKLREDYKKKAKGVRSDLLEHMQLLPSTFYNIDPLANFYRDMQRVIIRSSEMHDEDGELLEKMKALLEQLASFQPAFQQACKEDAKAMKASQDKIEPLIRNLQTALVNQQANADADGLKVTLELMNVMTKSTERTLFGAGEPARKAPPPPSVPPPRPPGQPPPAPAEAGSEAAADDTPADGEQADGGASSGGTTDKKKRRKTGESGHRSKRKPRESESAKPAKLGKPDADGEVDTPGDGDGAAAQDNGGDDAPAPAPAEDADAAPAGDAPKKKKKKREDK